MLATEEALAGEAMPEKYQKEIEEILEGLGQQAPDKPVGELDRPADDTPRGMNTAESAVQPNPQPTRRRPKITPSKVALLGLGGSRPCWSHVGERAARGTQFGPLINGWQPSAGPDHFSGRVVSLGIPEHDVTG